MDRLFLDANVLFSAAYLPKSMLRYLWQLAGVELISSLPARREAETNLALKRPSQVNDLASLSKSVVIVAESPPGTALPSGLALPANDELIFLAALHAAASHFLTGDIRHFGPYFGMEFGGVRIERPGEYLRVHAFQP